jgi:predicted PurR-regulated permease PerM
MESIELLLIVAVCIITISVVVGIIYLINVSVKIKKTATELENTIHKINVWLDSVNKVSDRVASSITGKLKSPVISAIYFLFYVFSGINKSKRKRQMWEGKK